MGDEWFLHHKMRNIGNGKSDDLWADINEMLSSWLDVATAKFTPLFLVTSDLVFSAYFHFNLCVPSVHFHFDTYNCGMSNFNFFIPKEPVITTFLCTVDFSS